jgi:hypothetical protein
MKKFFAVYMAPVSAIEQMMQNTTPDQRKKSMEEWMMWMKANAAMFVDQGAPLGKTKRVMDGGITDVKNDITGYSIVQAESHEAAAEIFKGSPHFQIPGAYVEVLEVVAMPEM